jgi:transcriptional regulator with XRE-family HTH domain
MSYIAGAARDVVWSEERDAGDMFKSEVGVRRDPDGRFRAYVKDGWGGGVRSKPFPDQAGRAVTSSGSGSTSMAEAPADPSAAHVSAARLREAREYLGFTREQAAEAAGWHVDRIITLEDGTSGKITALELRKLSRLYRRPPGWFTGEWEFHPDPDMVRQLNENPRLTEGDREAVLDFAEFLAGAGPAPKARKDRG